jgi:hypothetical protein
MPVILATQETEIRSIVVQSQPQTNKFMRTCLENTQQIKGGQSGSSGRSTPQFKPQYHKKFK